MSMVHLNICSCHITYVLQIEYTLYSCLKINELLARSTRKIWSLSDCRWTQTQNHLVRKWTLNHLAIDWGVFWVRICTVHLTVFSCHLSYAFQREFTFYSCLNFNELLARSRCKIWSLSDCKCIWTKNHLLCKRTRNHLAKLAKWWSSVLKTSLCGAFDCIFLWCHVRVSEWIHNL